MNCQEAILRLPWWLNGSLEPEERREVKEHLAGCAPCREALEETRLAWEIFGQHIPTEALVAYAANAADAANATDTPDGADRIDPALLERHLADCPECTAELDMVRASLLLTEHGDVPLLTPRPVSPKAPGQKRRRERGWQAAALAAGLTGLVAIGGWVGSVQKLHQARQAMESPVLRGGHPNSPVHSPVEGKGATAVDVRPLLAQLSPDAVVRGESAPQAPQIVKLPKSGEVAFLLNSPTNTPGEHAYRVLDAAGKELLSRTLAPSNLPAYFMILDSSLLPPGSYTVQLFAPANPAAGMQSFRFTVVP
jgi:anti-sigma factor RsiW